MTQVLFICTTGHCRAPYAAARLRTFSTAEYPLEGSAAGAYAGEHPRPVDRRAAAAAELRGLPLAGELTRQLTPPLLASCDLAVVLDEDSWWFANQLDGGAHAAKIQRLVGYLGDFSMREFPDPVLDGAEFPKVFGFLDEAVRRMVETLRRSAFTTGIR